MNINNPSLITRQKQLNYKPNIKRNLGNRLMTGLAALFSTVAVLPLILVLGYVLLKGASKISISLFTELPPPPGLEGGGIGNAIIGTFVVTFIAALFAIPVGVGGGIYLAEYASTKVRKYSKPIIEILAGIPTVVYGFFAALTVGPFFRSIGESLGLTVSSESALAAGLITVSYTHLTLPTKA